MHVFGADFEYRARRVYIPLPQTGDLFRRPDDFDLGDECAVDDRYRELVRRRRLDIKPHWNILAGVDNIFLFNSQRRVNLRRRISQ